MERTSILIIAIVSLLVTGVLGFFMIPWLKRLKYGQTIKEIGPTWHKSKEGTPTMGGLMFIIGSVAGLAVGYISLVLEVPQFLNVQYASENVRLFAGLGAALGFGAIGFADDYMKVVHHRNLGLRARYKIIFQVLVSAVYLYVMYAFGEMSTVLDFPFIGGVDLGVWFFVFSMLFIIFMVNAVNLTDGIDGLCSTVMFVACLGFIVISSILGYVGTTMLSTAIAAGCIGFIIWNFFPAKVFMGDTGSMFLGGAFMAMAYGVSFPMLAMLCGIVFVCEGMSVVIQMTYFRLSHGKRLFKMTPIHHHFELCGFTEIKIVVTFGLVALFGSILAVGAAFIR